MFIVYSVQSQRAEMMVPTGKEGRLLLRADRLTYCLLKKNGYYPIVINRNLSVYQHHSQCIIYHVLEYPKETSRVEDRCGPFFLKLL
jgi:hypothetical protein